MNDALLAEDEPVSRRFLDEAMQALGWRCSVVEDGMSALARATAQRFDLLVLDVNLPGLDGLRLLARLRGDAAAASRDARALALTADHDPALHDRLLCEGFDAVGHKPIALDDLARRIEAATGVVANLPVWDDAAALSAAGGQAAIVASLRELMRRDLPLQRTAITRAWERGDVATARAELHRLRAACGFCGAARLAQAIEASDRDGTTADRAAVIAQIDALLAP